MFDTPDTDFLLFTEFFQETNCWFHSVLQAVNIFFVHCLNDSIQPVCESGEGKNTPSLKCTTQEMGTWVSVKAKPNST